MLQIFTMDFGVYGCVVVAAETEEQARQLMAAEHYHYRPDEKVKAQDMPTAAGMIHYNLGDA